MASSGQFLRYRIIAVVTSHFRLVPSEKNPYLHYFSYFVFFNFQVLAEVGYSQSAALKRLFGEKVLPALKSVVAEENKTLEERVESVIQNAVEVCFTGKLYSFCLRRGCDFSRV